MAMNIKVIELPEVVVVHFIVKTYFLTVTETRQLCANNKKEKTVCERTKIIQQ